ncbi:MAG: phasin family protein [Rhizobiales bacterium]|nr:phasin family protein [Hyphomicrobiales bacterium]MBI3672665.1 phasin family protein [Hyphomicrobiales bacterium]
MIKSFEEFQNLGKDGMEAYVASANAFTKGLQAMAQEAADFSRKSFEKSSQVFERASAAKSLDKAMELQQAYAKEAYEAFLAQAAKFGELYVSTAQEAYKPFEASLQAFGVKPFKSAA